jgi:hypothetical protein
MASPGPQPSTTSKSLTSASTPWPRRPRWCGVRHSASHPPSVSLSSTTANSQATPPTCSTSPISSTLTSIDHHLG